MTICSAHDLGRTPDNDDKSSVRSFRSTLNAHRFTSQCHPPSSSSPEIDCISDAVRINAISCPPFFFFCKNGLPATVYHRLGVGTYTSSGVFDSCYLAQQAQHRCQLLEQHDRCPRFRFKGGWITNRCIYYIIESSLSVFPLCLHDLTMAGFSNI
jgi:hypothetical protein